jgi:alkanesulfonate monooxygenase SsuD/methylene tetrahydromethanopterin reductase-like flavin-dependent oxidoreductase (luciferase family)
MAVKADEAGFDCFLVTDHFMLSNANGNVDAWTLLPYLAAKTQRIRLGTCVTPVPFRPPALLAKMVATADVLSNGRIILGAGAGWHKPEFDGFSRWLETRERVAYTREAIELLIRLWTEETPVNYRGVFVSCAGAVVQPKPVQKPHPEIWFGSHSPYTLKLTGMYGRGWIPVGPRWIFEAGTPPDSYAQMKKVILQELKKRNLATQDFAFSMLIGHTDIKTLRLDVERYIEAGMNYFILGQPTEANESFLREIERVAEDIGESL